MIPFFRSRIILPFVILLLSLCLVFSFASCQNVTSDPFSFRQGERRYLVSGTVNGSPVSAEIFLGAEEPDDTPRTISVRYLSPSSPDEELTVTSIGGISSCRLGDAVLAPSVAERLLKPASVFLASGTAKIRREKEKTVVTVQCDDGEEISYDLSDGSLTNIRWDGGDLSVTAPAVSPPNHS